MTPPSEWHDWLTDSVYRVRVAKAALRKIEALPDSTQERLRRMLEDIASIADSQPPTLAGRGPLLLNLSVGRVNVRYSIDDQQRVICVEHVIVPDQEDFGRTG